MVKHRGTSARDDLKANDLSAGIHKAAAQISLYLLPVCFGLWRYVGADGIFSDKEFGGG